MRAIPFRKITLISVGISIGLALFLGLVYLVLPASAMTFRGFVGVGVFLSMMLFVFVIALFPILGIVEIVTSKNDTHWKILWGIVCLVLGIYGLLAYLFIARKERKG